MRKSANSFGIIGLPSASMFAGRSATVFGFRSRRLCSQRSCILVCMIYALYTFSPAAAPMSSASQHPEVPEVQAVLIAPPRPQDAAVVQDIADAGEDVVTSSLAQEDGSRRLNVSTVRSRPNIDTDGQQG